MKNYRTLLLLFTGFFLPMQAGAVEEALAVIHDAQSHKTGLVEFSEGHHGLLATIEMHGLTPGWHAIHVHATGDCSGEGFTSTGGHATTDSHGGHGFMDHTGLHAGDMPNIWAHADGRARAQTFLHDVTLGELMDADGAAVIVHADADDYSSQPSGSAGKRVACGVIF